MCCGGPDAAWWGNTRPKRVSRTSREGSRWEPARENNRRLRDRGAQNAPRHPVSFGPKVSNPTKVGRVVTAAIVRHFRTVMSVGSGYTRLLRCGNCQRDERRYQDLFPQNSISVP